MSCTSHVAGLEGSVHADKYKLFMLQLSTRMLRRRRRSDSRATTFTRIKAPFSLKLFLRRVLERFPCVGVFVLLSGACLYVAVHLHDLVTARPSHKASETSLSVRVALLLFIVLQSWETLDGKPATPLDSQKLSRAGVLFCEFAAVRPGTPGGGLKSYDWEANPARHSSAAGPTDPGTLRVLSLLPAVVSPPESVAVKKNVGCCRQGGGGGDQFMRANEYEFHWTQTNGFTTHQ